MCVKYYAALAMLLVSTHASAATASSQPSSQDSSQNASKAPNTRPKMYTTYFYTATEAVVHGYEPNTQVRLVSLQHNKTVWTGVVNTGETKLIPTGSGVFAFLSDKKASILVGTPSSCTAVGYWLRDENGKQRAQRFFTQLPSSVSHEDAKVIAWVWKTTKLSVVDRNTRATLFEGVVEPGKPQVLNNAALAKLGNHVLEYRSAEAVLSVQVYYDEGFFVPAEDGRASGRLFRTYVGSITNGMNDLNLVSPLRDTQASVHDLQSGAQIWAGTLKKATLHALTLSSKFVEVRAASEITVSVAPSVHNNINGYAEHHFGVGIEGMGIENDFWITTPNELWVFSYYANNHVRVLDRDGKQLWAGTLGAGHVKGVHPGLGFYHVVGDKGMSVMGGASACGAEYSPAGGMFRVDEEMFAVSTQIIEERRQRAAAAGRVFTDDDANAPLSATENSRAQQHLQKSLGQSLSAEEVEERFNTLQQQK